MMISGLIEREFERCRLPVRSGVLVVVVGASGAGKDTLIDGARAHFGAHDEVMFVRRVVTRDAEAAGEDHVPATPEDFAAAEAAGAFAVSWRAHGLGYGVPVAVDHHLAGGRVAVLNGSRRALPMLRARYADCLVVEIACARAVRAARLAARGRESGAEILARLDRDAGPAGIDDGERIVIDNSGDREDGVSRLVAVIRTAVVRAQLSGTF